MIIHLNRITNWWLTVVLLFVVNNFTESILNETVTFYTLDIIIKLSSLLTEYFYYKTEGITNALKGTMWMVIGLV